MAFVIITATGEPVCDLLGQLITLATREEARRFLLPGERVEPLRGDYSARSSQTTPGLTA